MVTYASEKAKCPPFFSPPTAVRCRESEEGRAHGLHAKTADDPQRDAKTSDFLAADGGTACLNHKTVADTFSLFPLN